MRKVFAKILWNKMKEVSSEEGRRETGCYIYRDRNTGAYIMGKIILGDVVANEEDTQGSITPGSAQPHKNGFDYQADSNYEAVGFMHSHTTVDYFDSSYSRQVGPSEEDEAWARQYKVPVYTVDYVGEKRGSRYYVSGGDEGDYTIYTTNY